MDLKLRTFLAVHYKSVRHGTNQTIKSDCVYTAMNLYTAYVNAMKIRQSPADQKQLEFIELLRNVQGTLANLLEDPLFIDSIHGEQEMGLDLALDLIDNIIARIDPKDTSAQAELMDRLELTAVDAD